MDCTNNYTAWKPSALTHDHSNLRVKESLRKNPSDYTQDGWETPKLVAMESKNAPACLF